MGRRNVYPVRVLDYRVPPLAFDDRAVARSLALEDIPPLRQTDVTRNRECCRHGGVVQRFVALASGAELLDRHRPVRRELPPRPVGALDLPRMARLARHPLVKRPAPVAG